MVQEELTGHQVEGGVVKEPAHKQESTETIIFRDLGYQRVSDAHSWLISLLTIIEISITAFCPEDEKAADGHVCDCGKCARPPNEWIADKIDLFVIFDPEVLHIASVAVKSRD